MEFIFENEIGNGHIGGSSARIMGSGKIIRISDDLKALGCPTEDFNKALARLAGRRDLGIPKRTSIRTKTGDRVTLNFEKVIDGKKISLPRFVTEKKNRVPVQ